MPDDRPESVEDAYQRLKGALEHWGIYGGHSRQYGENRGGGDGSGHTPLNLHDEERLTAECMWSRHAGKLPVEDGMLVTSKYILKPCQTWKQLSQQRKQSISTIRGIVDKAIMQVAMLWFADYQRDEID